MLLEHNMKNGFYLLCSATDKHTIMAVMADVKSSAPSVFKQKMAAVSRQRTRLNPEITKFITCTSNHLIHALCRINKSTLLHCTFIGIGRRVVIFKMTNCKQNKRCFILLSMYFICHFHNSFYF